MSILRILGGLHAGLVSFMFVMFRDRRKRARECLSTWFHQLWRMTHVGLPASNSVDDGPLWTPSFTLLVICAASRS